MSACPDKIYGTALADVLYPPPSLLEQVYPYEAQRQAALAWLGSNYLCHQPINRKIENAKQ